MSEINMSYPRFDFPRDPVNEGPKLISASQALDYEIRSSVFSKYISNSWLQDRIASYYAWKVNRKHARYMRNKLIEKMLKGALKSDSANPLLVNYCKDGKCS